MGFSWIMFASLKPVRSPVGAVVWQKKAAEKNTEKNTEENG